MAQEYRSDLLIYPEQRVAALLLKRRHLPIPISSSIGALLEEAPVVPQKNYSSVPVELSVVPQVHTNQTQLTRLKEPESRPEIFRLYETEIGPLTGMIADQLKSAEKDYPAEWFPMAFKECADHNARSWKYAEACLKNWKVNGFKSNGKNAQGPSKIVLPSPRLLCGNGDKLKRRAEGLDGTPSFSQALAEYQDHLATCHLCSGASNADSTMAQIKALVKEKSMK